MSRRCLPSKTLQTIHEYKQKRKSELDLLLWSRPFRKKWYSPFLYHTITFTVLHHSINMSQIPTWHKTDISQNLWNWHRKSTHTPHVVGVFWWDQLWVILVSIMRWVGWCFCVWGSERWNNDGTTETTMVSLVSCEYYVDRATRAVPVPLPQKPFTFPRHVGSHHSQSLI